MNEYLKKRYKSRDNELKYDFLPSMIEIIERPENKLVSVIMYVIILLIFSTILWACCFKLDIAVTSKGMVDTKEPLITINSLTDGVVSEVNINDGDRVKKGDIICKYKSDINKSVLEEYEKIYDRLSAQKEVYEKIYDKYKADDFSEVKVDSSSYGENSKAVESILMENDIFISTINSLSEQEKALSKRNQMLNILQNINDIDSNIESVKLQIENSRKTLDNSVVTSTNSGILTLKEKLYEGKKMTSGDTIGFITEEKNEFIFVAYVSDADINKIKMKDTVKIKIASYKDTKYELINGEVIRISDIPLKLDNKSVTYMVYLKLDKKPDDLKNGMEGTADIVIGTRTVMEYFLEPFKKGLNDSLKEK